MGTAEKRLKDRELVLLIADAVGGKLEGRTVAQKLAYFAGVELEQPTGHTPHFFGPFSFEVERALNLAALAGDFEETIERIPDWTGGPDAIKHTYVLTDEGKDEVAVIREAHPKEAEAVDATIKAITEAVPHLRQKTLSAAAKIHLIVSEQGRVIPVDELPGLAKQLGWRLSKNQIKHTVEVLQDLGLVEATKRTNPAAT
jgi:uncharacterized protein YwgA